MLMLESENGQVQIKNLDRKGLYEADTEKNVLDTLYQKMIFL